MLSLPRFCPGLAAITQVGLPKLRAGFSLSFLIKAELSSCTKSFLSTIPAHSQAHFLSPAVNDMYMLLIYAQIAVLCIISYEVVGVFVGNLSAIIMPKWKTLMTDTILPRDRKFVKVTSHSKNLKNGQQQTMSSPILNKNRQVLCQNLLGEKGNYKNFD